MFPHSFRIRERGAAWDQPSTRGIGSVQAETTGVPFSLLSTASGLPTAPKASQHKFWEGNKSLLKVLIWNRCEYHNAGLTGLPDAMMFFFQQRPPYGRN